MVSGVGEDDVEWACRKEKSKDVAAGDGGKGTAGRGFRCDMAGHEAVSSARKAAVGQQGHGFAKACADQRGSNLKHLAHARAALRSFVADHYNVAGLDAAALHSGKGGFFIVEDSGGAGEGLEVVACDFDDATFGRDIAFYNYEATGGLDRSSGGTHYFLA